MLNLGPGFAAYRILAGAEAVLPTAALRKAVLRNRATAIQA